MSNFIKFVKIELSRHLRNPSRIVWIVGFILVVQIYTVYAINQARGLTNYIAYDDVYGIVFNFILLVYIQSLPVLILVISFDSYVQDPTLKLSAVAAVNRHGLFLGKGLAITVLSFFIFLIEITFSSIFVIWIFGYRQIAGTVISKSIISFACIIIYYVLMFSTLILLVHKLTNDKLSTIVFPVLFFYVIPYLLSSSLAFQILDNNIINFSPIKWVIDFNAAVVFKHGITTPFLIFGWSTLVAIIGLFLVIPRYEFQN